MRRWWWLCLAGCAEEADLFEGAVDASAPPGVFVAAESVDAAFAPGVFLTGQAIRAEAPVVRGALAVQRARCLWSFEVSAVDAPPAPVGASWAFEVTYRPTRDELLQRTGVASVCPASVFPAGVAQPFTETYALDGANNQVFRLDPAGWTRIAANRYAGTDWVGWSARL